MYVSTYIYLCTDLPMYLTYLSIYLSTYVGWLPKGDASEIDLAGTASAGLAAWLVWLLATSDY